MTCWLDVAESLYKELNKKYHQYMSNVHGSKFLNCVQ